MDPETIKKLEELINLDGKTIVEKTIQRLTAPGQNYGSLMLSVDITVQTPNGTEEIQTVAKLIPPNEEMQELFNTQFTFRNEIAFYKTVTPMLKNFQLEQGMHHVIDFFPKYYGSRINLDPNSDRVDSDAVLLLENLEIHNYINLYRNEGLDLETAKVIITNLAELHAVSLAFKIKHPDDFKTKIMPYLRRIEMIDRFCKSMHDNFYKLVESMDECKPYLDRIRKIPCWNMFPDNPIREPFATICHNDCWMGNILVKQDKPIKCKLVDYQVYDYGSPAKDLIFFMFTTLKNQVLQEHCDDLIEFYHTTFIEILSELKCDATPFSMEAFQKELDYEAVNSQFCHIVHMLFPIYAPEGSVKDAAELVPGEIAERETTDLHKQRLMIVINEFAKRNWL